MTPADLLQLRADLGHTTDAPFAAQIGVDVHTLRQWIKGKQSPDPRNQKTLDRLRAKADKLKETKP